MWIRSLTLTHYIHCIVRTYLYISTGLLVTSNVDELLIRYSVNVHFGRYYYICTCSRDSQNTLQPPASVSKFVLLYVFCFSCTHATRKLHHSYLKIPWDSQWPTVATYVGSSCILNETLSMFLAYYWRKLCWSSCFRMYIVLFYLKETWIHCVL